MALNLVFVCFIYFQSCRHVGIPFLAPTHIAKHAAKYFRDILEMFRRQTD